MGIRKNAKFLTPAEKESFVRACVLLKADIVNPAAPAAQQYSKWDQYVAIHGMIQEAFCAGLDVGEFRPRRQWCLQLLQLAPVLLVPLRIGSAIEGRGVMVPYWDWSDPSPIMTETFLGPNGTVGNEVRLGYFAADAPGTGTNTTPTPAWWPAASPGWRLHTAFGTSSGTNETEPWPAFRVAVGNGPEPSLAKTTYSAFQNAVERGRRSIQRKSNAQRSARLDRRLDR